MTSAKRGREEESACDAPPDFNALYRAINVSSIAAENALDVEALRAIIRKVDSAKCWMKETLEALGRAMERTKKARARAVARDALEAAARALPPGGAVATFEEGLVDELFGTSLQPKDRAGEFVFMCTDMRITLEGVPVKIKAKGRGMQLDTVQDTFKGFTVRNEELVGEHLEGMKAAAKEAAATLLKSTPMRKVIELDRDPEFDGEGLPDLEYLVTVEVKVHVIFARPEGGWPFIPRPPGAPLEPSAPLAPQASPAP
jgi:hypothetical protein